MSTDTLIELTRTTYDPTVTSGPKTERRRAAMAKLEHLLEQDDYDEDGIIACFEQLGAHAHGNMADSTVEFALHLLATGGGIRREWNDRTYRTQLQVFATGLANFLQRTVGVIEYTDESVEFSVDI